MGRQGPAAGTKVGPLVPPVSSILPQPSKSPGVAGPVLWSNPLQRSQDRTLGLKRALATGQRESIPSWVLRVLGHECGGTQGAGSGVQGSDPGFLTPLPRGYQPRQPLGSPHSPGHCAAMWQVWDKPGAS